MIGEGRIETTERPADGTPLARSLVAMCEACERVPVPVRRASHTRYRGLLVCADCLAEEGIHVEDEAPGAAGRLRNV